MDEHSFVIFDLDGTLCDTRGDIVVAVNVGLAAVGLPAVEEPVVVTFVGDGVGRLVDRTVRHVGGDVSLAPEVASRLLAYYRAHPVAHTRSYPGIEELLELWRGRELAIASNKPTDLCEAIVDHFGWRSRFAEVLGSDWGGPKKPAPDPLVEIARRLGRPPEEGVFVGDSVGDMEAGRAAAMRTVAALYGYRPREDLLAASPGATIEAPNELPAVLSSLVSPPPARGAG